MEPIQYESIVSLQGDDYDGFESALYPTREPGSVVLPGMPDVRAGFAYLAQWDNGDGGEVYSGPGEPWGTNDTVVRFDTSGRLNPRATRSGYVMSYSTPYGYASLYRVTSGGAA